jgi:hypothetical protein
VTTALFSLKRSSSRREYTDPPLSRKGVFKSELQKHFYTDTSSKKRGLQNADEGIPARAVEMWPSLGLLMFWEIQKFKDGYIGAKFVRS